MTELILASSSPYRQQLLHQARIPFRALAPNLDEDLHKDSSLTPTDLVRHLSELKAKSLRPRFPHHWILGSDQALLFEGQVLGKPGDEGANIALLHRLKGKSHQLVTGAFLLAPEGQESLYFEDITTMNMRNLSFKEIETYVQLDQPWDCAGGYKFEEHGFLLFESVATKDPMAIQGLPLLSLNSWWQNLD